VEERRWTIWEQDGIAYMEGRISTRGSRRKYYRRTIMW